MRKRRLFRVVRFAVIALLVAEVCYVGAANAFLNLGGIQKALAGTDEILVTFQRAWTLWPGRVHVKNARIVFQDHNLQWSLDAERMDVDVAFLPFVTKTLHATRVRGEGMVFRVRLRVDAADANLASTRALPPMPEFETPALIPAYVPPPPRTDLWKIHAEDVDVGVVEVWAQQARYLGKSRARGAFRLHAGQHLWVGPASFDIESGTLLADERLLAGRVFGHVDCLVHPFFVNIPAGREVFRFISAKLDLHAADVRLEPFDLFLPPGTALSSPGARVDLAIETDHGVFTRQSHVELHGPELRGTHQGWVFEGSAFELGARTAPDGLGEATFRVERASASRSEKHESPLSLGAGKVAFATSSLDTSAEWALARVDVALSKLEIPALAAFDDLTKREGVRLYGGSLRLDANGRYSPSAISGEGRALVSRARGRAKSVGWELDGSVEASLGRVEAEALSADTLDLKVFARRLAVLAQKTRVAASDAHVTARARMSHASGTAHGRTTASELSLEQALSRAESVDLGVQARRLAVVAARMRVDASDARVAAHSRLTRGRGSAYVRTTASQLSLMRGMFRVAGKANADIELTAIDVSRGTVRASASALLATLDATSGHGVKGRARRVELKSEIWLTKRKLSRAWLQVAVPSLSFRSGNTTYAADANLFADTKDLDLANKRGSAIALVLVRNFSASNAVDPVKCQWLGVERATLRTTLAFTPEGETRVEVAGGLDAARGRWGDFEVTGSANLDARYLERATDLVTLDVGGRQLRMKSGTGKREGWEAEVQELHVVSTLERERWRLSGPVRIRAKQFEGRIGRTPVHADLAGDLRLDVLDLEHGEAIASGELFIDHGKLDAGAVHVKEWWGRVNIPTARLNVQENLNLFGSFSAKFRDGVPALGIFAASGDLPGWVPVLLPLHELESSGRFQRTCRTTDIFFEQASGGPLAAAGRIQSVPSDTRGAFLLQLQSLFTPSVGLVTYGDKVGVAVLVGNDWLSEQSKTLDGWAMGQSCKPAPDSCKPEPP